MNLIGAVFGTVGTHQRQFVGKIRYAALYNHALDADAVRSVSATN